PVGILALNMDTPPPLYEIRIAGHLSAQWMDWFEGLTVTLEEDGNTLLSGPVADQAALHGLLKKVRDLGMPLVSVNQVQFDETHQDHSKQGEMKMNSIKKIDTKVLLSTLWIVVMINMLKADILSGFIPAMAEELARTSVSVGASIPQLMLFGAIMGQLGIAMIILSRVLRYEINRWVNIVAGIVTIAYIWVGMTTYPHYIVIATVETLCLLLIVWFAWTWRNVEA
ncbi:MAG: DUF6326 family protein, partial [Chloroflexota bacterium]